MKEKPKPWNEGIPADLIPAIQHLRESFDKAHWAWGWSTRNLCYALLHNDSAEKTIKEHHATLMKLKERVGTAATHRFHVLLKQAIPSAIFKGFFDLYLEGMVVQALMVFKELLEIGQANETRLGISHLEWAESQTHQLICAHTHSISIWLKDVCDKQPDDPDADEEERIFWRKWQAPMLIVMEPSRYMPYDATTAWHRHDVETSLRLLKAFEEHYILHLDIQVKKASGEAALKLAKQSKTVQPGFGTGGMQAGGRFDSARRTVRKMDTHAMREAWKKKYRALKKSRPNMSDVWYSQQLARMKIAKNRNAETIRKHMKH